MALPTICKCSLLIRLSLCRHAFFPLLFSACFICPTHSFKIADGLDCRYAQNGGGWVVRGEQAGPLTTNVLQISYMFTSPGILNFRPESINARAWVLTACQDLKGTNAGARDLPAAAIVRLGQMEARSSELRQILSSEPHHFCSCHKRNMHQLYRL